jgi:D-sedoheptulose 7-phosphate isomerase
MATNRAWIKPSTSNLPPNNIRQGAIYYEGKGVVLENRAATYEGYFEQILDRIQATQITRDHSGAAVGKIKLETALAATAKQFRKVHDSGGRLIFIGNGGSAAIASHMAVDYTKNGNIRALALNDAATLTCFANDFGYDRVFEKQLEYQAQEHDAVVVISSSGRSLNIVGAAAKAAEIGCDYVVTLTGMNPNNRLRQMGHVNYYIPAMDYGIVEIAHLTLLHSMIGMA